MSATPTTTDVSTLYEVGNRKFFFAERTATGGFGTKEYHEGLMEVKIEFTSEITPVGADDDPMFLDLSSPTLGEGTVKFASLPYNLYSKFFDVKIDANGAIVIKSNAKAKFVAFGFYSQVGNGSESMFTMYKAVFEQPSLNSVSFDGKTIRDLTLNVKVYPHSYRDRQNKTDFATYTILNSLANATIWTRAQTNIYVPDATLPA